MSLVLWRVGSRVLVVFALGGAVALVGAAGISLKGAARGTSPAHPVAAPSAPPADPVDTQVVARNAFRLSRSPAPIAFDPLGGPVAVAPPEVRPSLLLTGLVLGSARAGLIRGIPGHDGARVLAEGDELGGVRVLAVDSAGAVLLWRGDTVRVGLAREGR